MNTPFDRDRPAHPAQGRAALSRAETAQGDFAAGQDFAAKQPVAFTSAALRETGETPAEAARRLGMIDPAFLRASREAPAATGPADVLVARREPAGHAAPALRTPDRAFAPQPPVGPDATLTARRAPGHAMGGAIGGAMDDAPVDAPIAPAARPAAYDAGPEAYPAQGHHPEIHAEDADPRAARELSAGERLNASLGGAAAGVKAFIAGWRARRAEAREAAAARVAQPGAEAVETARPHKLTAKEKRWRRRRNRLVFEEALGWVLVPVIVVGLYFAMLGGLAMFGMSIDDLVQGLNVAWSQLR